MTLVARRPTLDDYDEGRAGEYFAELIAGRVHNLYDVYAQSVEGLRERSQRKRLDEPSSSASEAKKALERFNAYRELERIANESARARAKARADRAALYRKEQAELRREFIERRTRELEEAEARRLLWVHEQQQWAETEAQERKNRMRIKARSFFPWGSGVFVQFTEVVTIKWNGHEANGGRPIQAGEVWNVGEPLAQTLIAKQVAELF